MGKKRASEDLLAENQRAKKSKLLDEESGEEELGFKINEEYARRFEHNNKRKELQRCEWSFAPIDVIFLPI
jgi:protein KRI1